MPKPKRLQKWFEEREIKVSRVREEVPLDWSDPDFGTYPHTTLTIQFPVRYQTLTTQIEWEQRRPHLPLAFRWNSEHLAYWFGEPSGVISGTQNGCDVDITTYTARPLWGLLGEHNYSD